MNVLNIPVKFPGNWTTNRLLSSALELLFIPSLYIFDERRHSSTLAKKKKKTPLCHINPVFTINVQSVWFLFPIHFLDTLLSYLIINYWAS